MLIRLLDTTKIDLRNPSILADFDTDLRRIDSMKHEDAPEGCDAYLVKVRPSTQTYRPGLYRFLFEIQYGKLVSDKDFEPLGEVENYQSETLPMI